jgi:hypothetical protein
MDVENLEGTWQCLGTYNEQEVLVVSLQVNASPGLAKKKSLLGP